MNNEQILWTVVTGLAVLIAWAALESMWRHSFPRTRARLQQWHEVSQGLLDVASRAPEKVKACVEHGDPVWSQGGPDGERYQQAESMIRQGELAGVRESIDGLLPDVAGFCPFEVTMQVRALRDTCSRAGFTGSEDASQDLPSRTQRLAQQVASAVKRGPALRRIIGFRRRTRAVERHDVITGLHDASSRAVRAVAESIEHQDPVWFSGPNGEQWQTGDSMIRMYEVRRVREDLVGLAARAASLNWAGPSSRAKALIAVCVSLEAAWAERPFRTGDTAAVEPLAQALRDALAELPTRARGHRTADLGL
jgi:hypothetical protein